MSDGLKPCPFCGGSPMVYQETSSDRRKDWEFFVECPHCEKYNSDKQKAIELWNRRTP